MDLFIVNRYKNSDEQTDHIKQEEEQFRKFIEKIEARQKVNLIKKELQIHENKHEQNLDDTKVEITSQPLKENNEILDIIDKNNKVTNSNKDKKQIKEFKVLGTSNFEKKGKVKRVLPHWLANPVGISTNLQDLTCKVEDQNWLHPTLKRNLLNEGISHLFPVQEKVIPFVLSQHSLPSPLWPSDVCVSAPTGSGKTLSFILPVIQVLMQETGCQVRALLVLPVQELAAQVAKVCRKYCTDTGLRVALLSGSVPLKQEQQIIVRHTKSSSWVSMVDIIVCTAGRLVEHLRNTEGFSLKHLKFLVIDEADRIMDHIQNDWLFHLDRHIKCENEIMTGKMPSLNWSNLKSQKASLNKLLFSATLSQDPEKLEQWGLFQPRLFSAAAKSTFEDDEQILRYTTPKELIEKYIMSEPEQKPLILYHLLIEEKWNRVLCFTNSSQSAHRLAVLLNYLGNGQLKVAELSAALDRTARETVLKKFQNSEINVLVGTDALARGIDIPNCDYVISYDPPKNIKTYVHRVGRTGRAGRIGSAITMLLQNQVQSFQKILKGGGKNELPLLNIPQEIFDKFSEPYLNAMQETKQHIHNEINSKVNKSLGLKRGYQSKYIKNKVRKIDKRAGDDLTQVV